MGTLVCPGIGTLFAMRMLTSLAFLLAFVFGVAAQLQQFNRMHCPDKCTCSRYFRMVSCVGAKLTSIPNDIPTCATELYLSKNRLSTIPSSVFSSLSNLTDLSLAENLLIHIEDGAFNGLMRLKRLTLRRNKLMKLSSDVFHDLVSLQYLYLTDNKISAVPDMQFAHNLIYLTLDNNRLVSAKVPPGFRNLTKLSTFVLSNNPELANITNKDFESLSHSTVRRIDLSRCSLSYLGPDVFNFPHLQSLAVSYNKNWDAKFLRHFISLLQKNLQMTSLDLSGVIDLPDLPSDIFANLSKIPLIHLNLAHMAQISIIKNGTFQYFPVLQRLDLSSSTFSSVEDSTMSSLRRLEQLILRGNKRLKLPLDFDIPSLQKLDLRYCNAITELPPNVFYNLRNLTWLSLKQCEIRMVVKDAFLGLSRLQTLDLSGNAIGDTSLPVNAFDPLNNLRFLDLSGNKLHEISSESNLFSSLDLLEELDMSGNQCEMLSPLLFDPLVSLKYLDLSKNRLGKEVIGPSNSTTFCFPNLPALKSLKLMQNSIEFLPSNLFNHLHSLRVVNLSLNLLQGWSSGAFNASINLTNLDVSKNQISVVLQGPLTTLPSGAEVNLTDNPFACWCDMIWFHRWITSENITESRLPGLHFYRCNSPEEMTGKFFYAEFNPEAIYRRCFPPPWLIIIASVSCGVAVIILFIVSLVYRYRWPLRLRWYYLTKARRSNQAQYQTLGAPEDDHRQFSYDLFISYGPSDADSDWVRDKLIPVIDEEERMELQRRKADAGDDEEDSAGQLPALPEFRNLHVFWEDRDVLPNSPEVTALAEGLEKSRMSLLVISEDYLKDGRRGFEIDLVVHKSTAAGNHLRDVILILMDRAAGVRVPVMLRPILNNSLEWSHNANEQILFWDELHGKIYQDQGIYRNMQV